MWSLARRVFCPPPGPQRRVRLTANPAQAAGAPTAPPAEGAVGSFSVNLVEPYKDQKSRVIADFEERYVRQLMKAHQGNVSGAARVAGIDRMSLHKILDRYDLDARDLAKT